MSNPFFKNHGPFLISEILKLLDTNVVEINKNLEVKDINDLYSSEDKDITFFHSKKYKEIAKITKASYCITTENLKNELPKKCIPLVVDNVLVSVSKLTSKFYPDSINDNFDDTVINIGDTKFKNKVKYGKNILIGENVSFGL